LEKQAVCGFGFFKVWQVGQCIRAEWFLSGLLFIQKFENLIKSG